MKEGSKRKAKGSLTKAQKKARRAEGGSGSEDEFGDQLVDKRVVRAVDRDFAELRDAQQEEEEQAKLLRSTDGAKAKEAVEKQAAEGSKEEAPPPADPYLLADAAYIQKDTRWRNKQRTIVFATRGVTHRFRRLVEDVRRLLPHHKAEPKMEKNKMQYSEINEICELKNCNNCVFFEARKRKHLYMWLARAPQGPTVKFQVNHIHISDEVRLAGNCLLGSRPILYFDPQFTKFSFLQVIRQLLMQAFGTPRNHPKSKPFHDHIMCFYYLDKQIWFRHYQIAPQAPGDGDEPERQVLTEIGPRFTLDPIRMFDKSFGGSSIFVNAHYTSPTMLSAQLSRMRRSPYVNKLKAREKRAELEKSNELPEDPLDETFA